MDTGGADTRVGDSRHHRAGAARHLGTARRDGYRPVVRQAILSYLNAPAGRISTYVEPQFEDEDGTAIPDGAIVVEWGKTRWGCLVEVKTGKSELASEQVNRYARVAATNGWGILSLMLHDPHRGGGWSMRAPCRSRRSVRNGTRHRVR